MKALFRRCLCSPSKGGDTAAARATLAASNSRIETAIAAGMPAELTPRELNAATDNFSGSRLIGGSVYGDVFRATLPGGRAAAAKRLALLPAAGDADFLRRQVAAASSRLRHDNVLRLLGYTITADLRLRVLLYELADIGTLHDALHGPRGKAEEAAGSRPAAAMRLLSWEQRVRIALDAAKGLAHLHQEAVAHQDVRSSNVMLFEGLRAKIADHNVFKQLPPEEKAARMSNDFLWVGYCPPEYMLRTGPPTPMFMDVFCFGVVLLELLTGQQPADRTRPRDKLLLTSWAAPLLMEGRVGECIDPKLGDQYPPAGARMLGRIALQCLHHDPTSRPSMDIVVARLISCDVIRQRQHRVVV